MSQGVELGTGCTRFKTPAALLANHKRRQVAGAPPHTCPMYASYPLPALMIKRTCQPKRGTPPLHCSVKLHPHTKVHMLRMRV